MQELYLTQLLHGWFGEWFELILWRPSPELECENHSKCSSTQLQDYCWQILVMAMSSGTRGRKTGSLEWGLSRVINIKHETRGDNDWEWRHWQQGRILVIVQRQSPCLNRQWWNDGYLSICHFIKLFYVRKGELLQIELVQLKLFCVRKGEPLVFQEFTADWIDTSKIKFFKSLILIDQNRLIS